MENASKALIIAGSVLLAVLIIIAYYNIKVKGYYSTFRLPPPKWSLPKR